MTGRIICGFPGVGKSYLAEHNPDFIDLESSDFDKQHFPDNYVQCIKQHYLAGKTVLTSTHKEVLQELINDDDIKIFMICMPHLSLKKEYLDRYRYRKWGVKSYTNHGFATFMEKNFDNFLNDLDQLNRQHMKVFTITLMDGQNLSDVMVGAKP